MIYLMKVGQIHESYKDLKKLYRHSFYIASLSTCPDNNLTETGTTMGRCVNLMRLMANGMLDLIEEDMQIVNN